MVDMVAEIQVNDTQATSDEPQPLVVDALGKFVLASIGALGLAQDGLEHLLQRMVERGQISKADARRLVQQLREKRFELSLPRVTWPSSPQQAGSDTLTKADVKSLLAEIATLSAKIDQITADSEDADLAGAATAAGKGSSHDPKPKSAAK